LLAYLSLILDKLQLHKVVNIPGWCPGISAVAVHCSECSRRLPSLIEMSPLEVYNFDWAGRLVLGNNSLSLSLSTTGTSTAGANHAHHVSKYGFMILE